MLPVWRCRFEPCDAVFERKILPFAKNNFIGLLWLKRWLSFSGSVLERAEALYPRGIARQPGMARKCGWGLARGDPADGSQPGP